MAELPQGNTGIFLETTQSWEQDIKTSNPTINDVARIQVKLYRNINDIALAVNKKDTGIYSLQEYVNGQLYPPGTAAAGELTGDERPVFRKVIDFGSLPNAATKTVAHSIPINNDYQFTRIYGVASDKAGRTYYPLPFSSEVSSAHNIALWVTSTNVHIHAGINRTNFTDTYVVLEYLKT